jgi:hypothetical protein
METVQLVPDTEEHPDQPLKSESAPGVARRVTDAPFATAALQPTVEPVAQLNPSPVIVPAPVPLIAAVSR